MDDEFFTEVPSGVVVEDDKPRDGHRRYLLPDVGGDPNITRGRTRVTTLSGSMDDGFGLTRWRRRTVVRGMGLRPDLMARAGAADPNDPGYDKLLDSIEAAAFEAGGGSSGSNLGSAQHHVFDRYFGKGEPIESIAEYFHADIRAVEAELARKKITLLPGYNEAVVYCQIYDRGGKIDGLARLEDGTIAVLDWKTEKDPVEYPDGKTIQLSYYANSDHKMNYDTHQFEELPPIRRDIAIVIWCRPGSGEAKALQVPIDLGWVGARVAEHNRAWRQQKIVISEYFPTGQIAPSVISQEQVIANAITPEGRAAPNAFMSGVADVRSVASQETGYQPGVSAQVGQMVDTAVQTAQQTGQPINSAQVAQMNAQAAVIATHPTTMAQAGLTGPVPAQPPGQPVVGPGTAHQAADLSGPPAGSVPADRPPAPKAAGKATPPAEYIRDLIERPSAGIDPEAFYMEMQMELADLSKKDQLQPMLRLISPGINENDLKKHRGPLADMLVEIVKRQRAIREGQPTTTPPLENTPQFSQGQAAWNQPQPQPTNGFIDLTHEGVLSAIASAPNVERLTAIYQQWTHNYGPHTWVGTILDAANQRMTQLNQPQPTH